MNLCVNCILISYFYCELKLKYIIKYIYFKVLKYYLIYCFYLKLIKIKS